MARTTFRLPGTDGPDITVERAPMRRARVFVGAAGTWARDDRTIACIAIGPDGTSHTGSVRGTAQ